MNLKAIRFLALSLGLIACGDDDGTTPIDAGASDSAAPSDAATADGAVDSSVTDAGPTTDGSVAMTCGNGRIDPGEECDGADLGGQTCEGLGLEGTLACSAACTFDQMGCTSPGCPAGRRDCGGTCVDLNASQSNCGACGVVCGDEAFCNAGTCQCNAEDEVVCGSECVPVSNENCGTCGNDCGDAARCAEEGGTYACHGIDLRINDQGLLEAGVGGTWRGVCDNGFFGREGLVACRQMGLLYTSHAREQRGPSDEFWVDGLDCDGSERGLIQCESRPLGEESCDSNDWVQLVCDEVPAPTGNVRIRGGLLEYRAMGQWRGVCDDNFGYNDALVACREMGLAYVDHDVNQVGPNEDFWWDDLECDGSESTLSECEANSLGSHNCGMAEWVALTCQEV